MVDRLTELRAMLADEPDDVFLLYAIAQEHARQNDLPQAVAFYDRVIEVDPAHGYAYYHKARCQQARGDVSGARDTILAGLSQMRLSGDAHAAGELEALLDEFAE